MFALAAKRRRRVLGVLLALLSGISGCKRAQQTKTLTFQEIFAADSVPAERGHRVVVKAQVLYSDPLWNLLIVQDSSQAVYIDPPKNLELHAGDLVQITGATAEPGKLLDATEFRL